jgi:hypothetical protein
MTDGEAHFHGSHGDKARDGHDVGSAEKAYFSESHAIYTLFFEIATKHMTYTVRNTTVSINRQKSTHDRIIRKPHCDAPGETKKALGYKSRE